MMQQRSERMLRAVAEKKRTVQEINLKLKKTPPSHVRYQTGELADARGVAKYKSKLVQLMKGKK